MNSGTAKTPGGGHDGFGASLSAEVPAVPDHTLLRRIGRGSYGEVWLARNVIGTWRAVKIVHRATFERAEHFEREFKGIQKFEPISRSHEGFVDVLQIGRNDEAGYFYYVMELADSVISNQCSVISKSAKDAATGSLKTDSLITDYSPKTLRAEQQRHTRLPVSNCVDIGVTLASALAHLHQHGLVHRDIKPSNIIFVGGVPKLADIGLVAEASEARSFVGTVGFIPPEGPGSPQADLYSLGKVLYEISTGQDRQDFPQLPPDLLREDCGAPSPSHPRPSDGRAAGGKSPAASLIELNEVFLRACHKDLRQRYPSADAMRADLELLQRGQSVQRNHAAERRFAVAKKLLLAAVALSLLLAGVRFAADHFSQRSGRLSNRPPKSWKPSPEAEKFCKEGWAHLQKQSRDGLTRSIESFIRAIELEPNYALAYCGLSDAYWSQSDTIVPSIQALPEARKNARLAVEIDDSLPDGHLYLGVSLMSAYDFAGAEAELKRAVALGPSNGWAHTCYATLLRCVGRTEQARELQKRASELEPIKRHKLRDWYYQLWSERRFEEAAGEGEKLSLIASNWVMTPWLLGRAYAACGRLEEAARELSRTRMMDDDPDGAGALGYVYARMGKTNEARTILLELKQWRGNRYVCPHADAYVYAGLGETAEAIRQLQLAYENQCRALTSLKYEPFWDGLRTDSRFVELLKKIGLDK